MTINNKLLITAKNLLFSSAIVFSLMQCTDEEIVAPSSSTVEAEATAENDVDETSSSEASVASLTTTGIHTAFATLPDCSTCTYVVAGTTHLVDGKELGFKPGDIICLDKKVKYGALEFTNLEGTSDNPIIIANCGLDKDNTESTTRNESEENPY